ncbi:hypothetical protein PG984_016510 [Apiospora sp. TS-2023a]
MPADTNGVAHMCAVSDIENSNDNDGGSISGSNRGSNEDESRDQGKYDDNNDDNSNKNFVLKFRSRRSENQAALQRSSHSPNRTGIGDAQAGFVFLLLSASGLAAHAAFKQQHLRSSTTTAESIGSTKTKGSAKSVTTSNKSTTTATAATSTTESQDSSGTSSQGNDGGTRVLTEFRFLHGCSNLGGGPPDSTTKKPRAHLAVAVPSTGNTITGESNLLLEPTTVASVLALLDEDEDEITTNNKADNDSKTENSDGGGAANRNSITPEEQDENPSTEETTGALEQEASQQSIGDQQSESAEDTPTTAKKRILSMDLSGGSETSSVVGRILLSLLSGTVDEKPAEDEKANSEDEGEGDDEATESAESDEEGEDTGEDEEPTGITVEEEEYPEVFYRVHIHRRHRNNTPQQVGETAQDGIRDLGGGPRDVKFPERWHEISIC